MLALLVTRRLRREVRYRSRLLRSHQSVQHDAPKRVSRLVKSRLFELSGVRWKGGRSLSPHSVGSVWAKVRAINKLSGSYGSVQKVAPSRVSLDANKRLAALSGVG